MQPVFYGCLIQAIQAGPMLFTRKGDEESRKREYARCIKGEDARSLHLLLSLHNSHKSHAHNFHTTLQLYPCLLFVKRYPPPKKRALRAKPSLSKLSVTSNLHSIMIRRVMGKRNGEQKQGEREETYYDEVKRSAR